MSVAIVYADPSGDIKDNKFVICIPSAFNKTNSFFCYSMREEWIIKEKTHFLL